MVEELLVPVVLDVLTLRAVLSTDAIDEPEPPSVVVVISEPAASVVVTTPLSSTEVITEPSESVVVRTPLSGVVVTSEPSELVVVVISLDKVIEITEPSELVVVTIELSSEVVITEPSGLVVVTTPPPNIDDEDEAGRPELKVVPTSSEFVVWVIASPVVVAEEEDELPCMVVVKDPLASVSVIALLLCDRLGGLDVAVALLEFDVVATAEEKD